MRHLKLVFVGENNVGKTSLLITTTSGSFPSEYIPTVFDNYSAQWEFNGQKFLIGLWDTAGATDYDRLRPLSYPQTDIFIFCFDLNQRESLQHLKNRWIEEISHHCPNAMIVVWGNKLDLLQRKKPIIRWIQKETQHHRKEKSWKRLLSRWFSFSSSSSSSSNHSSASSSIEHSNSTSNDNSLPDKVKKNYSTHSISEISESASINYFNELPDEILLYIINYCSINDTNQWCQVNRRWHQCLASDSVWEKSYYRELQCYYQTEDISEFKEYSIYHQLEETLNEIRRDIPKKIVTKHSMLNQHKLRPAVFKSLLELQSGVRIAKEIGALLYVESSSKTGDNLNESWHQVLHLIWKISNGKY